MRPPLQSGQVQHTHTYLRVSETFLHLRPGLEQPHGEQEPHNLTHLEDEELVHLVAPHVLRGVLGFVEDEGRVLSGGTVVVSHHQGTQQWYT